MLQDSDLCSNDNFGFYVLGYGLQWLVAETVRE